MADPELDLKKVSLPEGEPPFINRQRPPIHVDIPMGLLLNVPRNYRLGGSRDNLPPGFPAPPPLSLPEPPIREHFIPVAQEEAESEEEEEEEAIEQSVDQGETKEDTRTKPNTAAEIIVQPQLRNLQEEVRSIVPAAAAIKQKLHKESLKRVEAAPDDEGFLVKRPKLAISLKKKKTDEEHRIEEEYEKLMKELAE